MYVSLHFHIVVHNQRNSGQELKQERNLEKELMKPWKSVAYWLALHSLLSLLSSRTQEHHPRVGNIHIELDPLT